MCKYFCKFATERFSAGRNDRSSFYLGLVDKLHHSVNLFRINVTKRDDRSLPSMISHPTRPFSFNAQQITLGLDIKMSSSHTVLSMRRGWSLVTAAPLPQHMLGATKKVSQKSSFVTFDTAQSTTHDRTN